MTGAHRWTRRLLVGLGILLGLLVAAAALLQTSPVATWAVRKLVRFVPLNPGYALDVERVSGNWLTMLQLENVRLRQDGRELGHVARLQVRYDPRRLTGSETHLTTLTIDGVRATARQTPDGWDLAHVLQSSSDTTGGGRPFVVDSLAISGVELTAVFGPDSVFRVRNLGIRIHGLSAGEVTIATVDTLAVQIAPPGPQSRWLSLTGRGAATTADFRLDPLLVTSERSRIAGAVVVPRRWNDDRAIDRLLVKLDAAPLAMADIAAWVPSLRPEGDLQLALRASAKDRVVTGRLTGRLGDAAIVLDGSTLVGSNAPVDLRAHGTIRELDPARVAAAGPAGRINSELAAELQGRDFKQANGRVDFTVTRSRIADIAIERVGLRATIAAGRADLALHGNIGAGTVTANGWARLFDSMPSYNLTGEARGLPGTDSLVRQLAGHGGDPVLALRFHTAGMGVTLSEARANGRVDLAAIRRRGERIVLGHAPFALVGGRLELQPELLIAGGRITGLATARFGDTVTYEIRRGTIERVDLGQLTGDTIVAPLFGRFALTGRGTAPAEAIVTARLDVDELRYGKRRIEQVTATVRFDRGQALIEAGGSVQGGRFALDVGAHPFDSTRTFVIRRALLDRVDLGTLLDRPAVAGPVTLQAGGTGRWSNTTRVFSGRVDMQPSKLGRVDVQAGSLVASLNHDRATYDLSVYTNGGALAVTGDAVALQAVPVFRIQRGRFDSLDLAALLGRPQLTSRFAGRFAGSVSGRQLDSVRANFAVDLLPSHFGSDTIREGRLALDVDRGAIRGDLLVESSAGRFVAQAALQAASDTLGLASLGGRVTATGVLRGIRLDTLLLALDPLPGAIAVDTIVLRSNVAALDGAGRVALRQSAGTDTLRLVGHARDLIPVTALAGLDTISVDSARLDLTLTGPHRQWYLASRADVRRLLYVGKQAERVAILANAWIDSTGVSGLAGELKVEGAAVGKVPINQLSATVRYDSVVSLQLSATVHDSVHLVTALRGTAVGDTMRTTLERLDLVEGGRAWTLEQPTRLTLRPWVELDSFSLRAGDRRILLNGKVDPHGSSDLAMRVDALDLDILSELGLAPVPGRLDANLRLTGPAATPTLDGRVGLTVRRGAKNLGEIATDLSWTAAGLKLKSVAAPDRGGPLTMTGALPWELTLAPDTGANASMMRKVADTLTLTVAADSFDLAFFDPLLPRENAKNLRGLLALDTRISGTFEEPRVEGKIRITGAGIALPPLGLEYRQSELAGDFIGSELRITRLRLLTDDKEELLGQGTVRFRPLTDPVFNLAAELRDFRISNSPELHAVASGKLKLAGTAAKPSLAGTLRLGRTEVFQGAEGAPVAVKPVELGLADLQELAQHFGASALARAKERPGLVERFHLDVNVRLPRNVWFRRRVSPRTDIELSGAIKITQEPGQAMQLNGRVEPTPGRGFLDVYGRNFKLTGGEIVLAGPVDSMTLDVTAQYQVPTQSGPDAGILIDVAAKGRPDSLALDFTSEPSMGQEDIIAYIVTGRPASENPLAAQGGSAGEAGKELAFGALSERLAGAAGEKLGLDVFQIKQDGLRGLTLTAGRYVAPRVFLSLQQPIQLSSGARQAPGSNLGPGFELEYSARSWLRANLRGGSLPPRFFLRGRHAY